MVNLLWGSSSSGGSGINQYAIPRLGIDAFIGSLTLGGSIGFVSSTGSSKWTATSSSGVTLATQADLPDVTRVMITPRIGYVFVTGEHIAIWLRGGFTYFSSSVEEDIGNSTGGITRVKRTGSGTSLTLDPQLVILPVPHAGITFGPVLDIGLGGSLESDEAGAVTVDTNESTYGVGAGLLLYF